MEAATNQYSICNVSQQTAFCKAQYAKKLLRNPVFVLEREEGQRKISIIKYILQHLAICDTRIAKNP